MLYFDYTWDLSPRRIKFDPEISFERLNWQPGQYWLMCEENGMRFLRRVDPLVEFTLQGCESKDNGHS